MKKTLLAVAVAAALPAVAFAQTNVTLYGIADAGVGFVDTDGPGADAALVVNSGYQSTSRFGIRGTEDLGSGLKATFNLEAGVRFDEGRTDSDGIAGRDSFFQRRAVVGLAGGFGEVRLGRDYTPGFSAMGTTDVMGYGLYGNWLTFTAGASGISTRVSNGIHYTGTFSGVTIRAMYATGETNDQTCPPAPAPQPPMCGDKDIDDAFGISAVYVGGPLTVQGYYQELNGGRINTPATLLASNSGETIKQMGIGAGYNFGAFRITAAYGQADADGTAQVIAGADEVQAFGIGAGIKLGTGELLAQYIQIEADAIGGGSDPDPDAKIFGIAYVHPLSKRTNLYATYGMARNNSTGRFAVLASDNSAAPGAAGADPQGFAVGIRHLF